MQATRLPLQTSDPLSTEVLSSDSADAAAWMSSVTSQSFSLFHLFWIAGATIAAATRSDLFHKAFVCVAGVSFIVYIGALFAAPLRGGRPLVSDQRSEASFGKLR
jgi:uncharacterized membrane protein YoaK (UPF0700 family)